jgi:hypothetical protein
MNRYHELPRWQKGLILALGAMALVFLVLYAVVSSRVGFLYRDAILLPLEEPGAIVYSGTVRGEECAIRVTEDHTVTFLLGSKTYGPYTVKEDPTAIPQGRHPSTKGYEVRRDNEILFRGYLSRGSGFSLLYKEDGKPMFEISVSADSGIITDVDGNVIDPMEPSIYTLLELVEGPELTRKGHWGVYFLGLLFSVICVASIFFADELFRFRLSFRVSDPYLVDPSAWELMGRQISWIMTALLVLTFHFIGLR